MSTGTAIQPYLITLPWAPPLFRFTPRRLDGEHAARSYARFWKQEPVRGYPPTAKRVMQANALCPTSCTTHRQSILRADNPTQQLWCWTFGPPWCGAVGATEACRGSGVHCEPIALASNTGALAPPPHPPHPSLPIVQETPCNCLHLIISGNSVHLISRFDQPASNPQHASHPSVWCNPF